MASDEVVGPHRVRKRRGPARAASAGQGAAVVALLLAAVNLRPAVTSLGPVLEEVRAGLGVSAGVAGVLTSVPAACFALVGFLAPRPARRYGPGPVITAGLAAAAVGLALRPFTTGAASFIGATALALAGIAVANVLLPAVVKERFPERVGMMTGLYAMALNLGASAAAALTVPVAQVFGGDWRIGLAVWAALAALAVPPWLALARSPARPPHARATAPDFARDPVSGPVSNPEPRPEPRAPLTRDPTAWALAVYFGLQATAAYVVIGWLPQIYRDAGLSAGTAGLLFALTSVLGIPLSFALSAAAGGLRSQSGIAVTIGVFGLAGYTGLWAAPATAPWLWAVLLGIANCSFPLALTMIGMRGRDGAAVIRLSAFAQSTGYLLSIPGPVLVGALYQHTGSWRTPLLFMSLLMLPQLAAGLLAGRDRRIG
ncbi:MFS transporter [Streptomyces sp. NPDC052179]|uniref:CynX/NimT family MFS transporter n=1 Tax=Streptomyces sp. NPDC052179 TaxID=3155680 RepID=UPI00342465A1